MFAASGWPKTPNTPHSSWNLSSSIGSLKSFSSTASPGERGDEAYRAGTRPATMPKHTARTRTSARGRSFGPGRPPGKQPFADAAVRLASAHAGGQGGAHRRGAHEAARALPAAHAEDALGRGRKAAGVRSAEPPRHAQAARRPDLDQRMAGARPGPSAEPAPLEVGARRRRPRPGARPARLEGLHRLAPDQGRERLPLRHHLVEARRALGGRAALDGARSRAAAARGDPRDDPRV